MTDLASGPPRILAIAGTGQNGATLYCRMLGELPGFVAVGEIGRLWEKGLAEDVECSCGQAFSSCAFWSAVGQQAFGGWDRLDVAEARRLSARLTLGNRRLPHPFALPLILLPWLSRRYRRDLGAYATLLRRVYDAVLAVSGERVVVDSMKIPAHIYLLARRPEFDASFLQLVRDPRGVAYSNTKKVARQGSRADKPMRTQRTPRKTATKWLWFNASFELLRALGHPFTQVRYEDLVRDPLEAVRLGAARVGIEAPSMSFLEGAVADLPPGHLVAGNRMRHQVGPIEVRLDEAWREGLSAEDRRRVERITLPLRRRYGYGR